ncbi:hypothetical protein ABFT80_20785 [Mesorhizobium sp. SB112]|uniref:hypothetical protein n=1 Tax=Mesorhizobium sp. SB112 TaxID=3151853 RepID=UPI003267EAA6
MSIILAFVPRRTAQNAPKTVRDTPASIIIFPGVRYEREKAAEGVIAGRTGSDHGRRPTARR